MNRRTLSTWTPVGIGIAALAAVATIVGPFGSSVGPFGSTTDKLVVHCHDDQLLAYAGNYWNAGGVAGAGHPYVKPVASSHDSATTRGSAEFDLPPGIYTVTTNIDPSPCEALAWVAAGETTTTENHTEAGGLYIGAAPSEVAQTPDPTPTPTPTLDVPAARRALLAAYTTLTRAEQAAAITFQSDKEAGITAQYVAQQVFEGTVSRIMFPDSAFADISTLFHATDAYYRNGEGSLAAVTAAVNTVTSDLGG